MNRRDFLTLMGLSPLAALSLGDASREPHILDFLDSGALRVGP